MFRTRFLRGNKCLKASDHKSHFARPDDSWA